MTSDFGEKNRFEILNALIFNEKWFLSYLVLLNEKEKYLSTLLWLFSEWKVALNVLKLHSSLYEPNFPYTLL